jgi:hypothetical protein
MSITLLCLVKGNTTANAFPVDIDKDQLVGHLKKVIKAEQPQTFANVDAKDLKLWKVTIPGDQDDQLRNLILQDSDELLAIRKISKYFPDSPPEESIHVIVEPPESTATSSREQELLEEVASLKEKLSKNEYGTYEIVRKTSSWEFTNQPL